ncbi:DUF4062 domain-containing protein [Candidatus Uabimicrobium sp. HlEnr_7]|uniref:DUF4062 domain-containing protein n=1 Tax=Candidatus Uabimicrobium helgolandensis TaxID=3095367 RepID=UPI0035576078
MHIWTTLKFFISSTFKDMELERDHLAIIFQKLQQKIFERRLHIIPYDLRWREKHHSDLVNWCIDMVLECQYFVGILGYRYGWRPGKDANGNLNSAQISITEMEIKKALETIPKHRRFFCFGDVAQYDESLVASENEQDRDSLERLKQDLELCQERIFYYTNPNELLEIIANNIEKIIDEEYPPGVKVELQSYSKEDALKEIIEEKRRGFVGQEQHLQRLTQFACDKSKENVLAIEAVAGTGKSALLAQFIHSWQGPEPIIAHYMSMAGDSRSVRGVTVSLAQQLHKLGFIDDLSGIDMTEQIHQVLQTTSQRIVIAIDGIDEMNEEGHDLLWIPQNLSENVRLVLTTRPTSVWPRIQTYLSPQVLSLPPLNEDSIRLIIRHYQQEQQSSITIEEENILVDRACGSPLFLKVALDEMSAGGIAVGQLAETVESLFFQILNRLEDTYSKDVISCYLGLIAASRSGLTEVELRDILLCDFGTGDDLLVILQNDLANFVIQREKLLAFFHPEFERSVKMWLGKNNLRNYHLRLAKYFKEQGFDYERSLTEIAYQMQWGEDYSSLLKLFANIDFLEKKCNANMLSDLRNDLEFATTSITVPLPQDLEIEIFDDVAIKKDSLVLISSIIDLDLHFLVRHPQCLIQSLWNHGYWYDAPESRLYYKEKKPAAVAHFYKLVDYLRKQKAESGEWTWIQSLSPLPETLNAATIKIFRGHEDIVTSVATNKEQSVVISGSWDQTLNIWNVASGRRLMSLKGHEGYISSVSFCHPQKIVSASGDKTLRIWNVQNGNCVKTLSGHTKEIACVSSNENGQLIVSGAKDKTVRVWNSKTGECLHVLEGHTKTVNGVFVSNDEKLAVSASWDNTIRMWCTKSGKCLRVFEGHERDVKSVCMDKDNRLLFSASRDYTARIWDIESGECLQVLSHKSTVFTISCDDKGEYVATGVFGTIRVWETKSGRCVKKFEGHESAIFGLHMTGDGQKIISGSSDKTIRLWDANCESQISFPIGHSDNIQTASFSHCNRLLLTSSKDTDIHMWDVTNGRKIKTIATDEYIRFAHYTTNDKAIYFGGNSKNITFYNLENQNIEATLKDHKKIVLCAKISRDNRFLVSGDRGRNVYLWDVVEQKCIQQWKEHEHDVRSVDISEDNRYVVSGAEDRTIHVWDVEQQKLVAVLHGHKNGVTSVAFVKDKIISASRDNTIRYWDHRTQSCLKIIEGNCNVEQFFYSNSCYVTTQELETTCQNNSHEKIAFFPSFVRNSFMTPNGYICGYGGSYTYFLRLWNG